MSSGTDPWADPSTPTEPGTPYAGPPPTAPPGSTWAPPGYASPGYGPPGYPSYGYPPPGYGYPWPVVPRGPRRPGQVIASAVLAFVQSAMVIIASIYVWFFASVITVATAGAPESFDAEGLAAEGTILAAVQFVSAVLLITAGVLALNRRSRTTWLLLVGAHALQIALAIYWLARLLSFADDLPGPDTDAVLPSFTLFFAAGPIVGLALVLFGGGRSWFAQEAPAAPSTGVSGGVAQG